MPPHTSLEGICSKETLRDKFEHYFNPLNLSAFWTKIGIPRSWVKKIAPFYEGLFYNQVLGKENSDKMNYDLSTWTYSIGSIFA